MPIRFLPLVGLLSLGCSEDKADARTPGPDGSTPSVAECFEGLDAGGALFTEVQSFETDGGAIRITRARRPGNGPAVGETFAYELVRFRVESDDDVACVTQASAFTYEYGHHNWTESWTAETSLYTYAVTEELTLSSTASTWTDRLTVTGTDGAPVVDGASLRATGCYSVPYDLNPCMSRERTDSPPPGFGE